MLDLLDGLGEEGVTDGRDDDADGVVDSLAQGARHEIDLIAEAVDRLMHPLASIGSYPGIAVDDAGRGLRARARGERDVAKAYGARVNAEADPTAIRIG